MDRASLTPSRDEGVAQLSAMGFSAEQAREALTVSDGNVESAVNYILGSSSAVVAERIQAADAAEPLPRNAAISAKADGGLLQCSRSQYSVEEGRSACTCIALTAASKFLQSPNVTTDFLEEIITEGVATYHRLNSSSTVEHLSAEEVLRKPESCNFFPVHSLEVRQGLLSDDFGHPLGLRAMLEAIYEGQPREQWMAVLLTKTPETVLLCFPPKAEPNPAFWLIDSHPRPQLGVNNAYAKLHPSLDGLWMSLQAIFPPTELGLDIPEMMATMYNSFDLYPLLLPTS